MPDLSKRTGFPASCSAEIGQEPPLGQQIRLSHRRRDGLRGGPHLLRFLHEMCVYRSIVETRILNHLKVMPISRLIVR